MKRATNIVLILIVGAALVGPTNALLGWGFPAHKRINQQAAQLMSGTLGDFYRSHESWIVSLAIDADLRKSYSPEEGPSHYIDFEYYGEPPYTRLPQDRREAQKTFGKENLPKWGTLPWHVTGLVRTLADAMRRGQWERVVVLSADLGHFVGDGHQPLHTTKNYDGKESGNDGIHAMFESEMVNANMAHYQPASAELVIITDLETTVWSWFIDAHQHLPALLTADTKARKGLSESEKEALTKRWGDDPPPLPQRYMKKLYKESGALAWQQMDLAALHLASLWQWAWIEAGKPTPPSS